MASPAQLDEQGFVSGTSPVMVSLEGVIAEIAPTNIPVLLVGESGTGKQMFAQRIHRLSTRCNQKFLKLTCAAMNPDQIPDEIKPAPSDNLRTAGTIFLDEIGELDAASQRSLLYTLPDGNTQSSDKNLLSPRVIAATSRNLDEEMRAGRFRTELYYRINGVSLRLPPLRERKEDIVLLAESFLTLFADQFGRQRPSISSKAIQKFLDYSWPGNIRELENVIKKFVALNDETLALAELDHSSPAEKQPLKEASGSSLKAAARAASREAERGLILKALERTRWNRKRAAQELQISYKSLLDKLKQIGLQNSESN